jgi:hypothetical protein
MTKKELIEAIVNVCDTHTPESLKTKTKDELETIYAAETSGDNSLTHIVRLFVLLVDSLYGRKLKPLLYLKNERLISNPKSIYQMDHGQMDIYFAYIPCVGKVLSSEDIASDCHDVESLLRVASLTLYEASLMTVNSSYLDLLDRLVQEARSLFFRDPAVVSQSQLVILEKFIKAFPSPKKVA